MRSMLGCMAQDRQIHRTVCNRSPVDYPLLSQAKRPSIGLSVRRTLGKTVKRPVGHADNMVANKLRSFRSALFRMLDAALPLQNCPAGIVILSQLAENLFEIDLSVAKRAEPARPVNPTLIAAVDSRSPVRPELGIFHMESPHAFVVDVEESQVIHLLQDHVARVVEDGSARMPANHIQKPLKGSAVVQVLAWVQFKAQIYTGLVKLAKDRQPAPPQFLEGLVDQSRRPLRKRIKIRPREGARERHMSREPKILARLCAPDKLLHRPRLSRLGVEVCGRKARKHAVVSRIAGHPLSLQVRAEFGDLQSRIGKHAANLVAIGLAFGSQFQVKEPSVPSRNLRAHKAKSRRPTRDAFQGIERCLIGGKLRQDNPRSLDRFHVPLPIGVRHSYLKGFPKRTVPRNP